MEYAEGRAERQFGALPDKRRDGGGGGDAGFPADGLEAGWLGRGSVVDPPGVGEQAAGHQQAVEPGGAGAEDVGGEAVADRQDAAANGGTADFETQSLDLGAAPSQAGPRERPRGGQRWSVAHCGRPTLNN